MPEHSGDTLPSRLRPDTRPTQADKARATRAEAARQRYLAGQAGGSPPPLPPKRRGRAGGFFSSPGFVVIMALVLGLFFFTAASAAAGWTAGRSALNATATVEAGLYLFEQYNQALADMEHENYELALGRLEFIFASDPEFLNVAELWVEVQLKLGRTSSGDENSLLSETATPTPDPRPKEQLLAAAQGHIAAREWTQAIDTLLSLRQADSAFHTVEVDGMLFLALRNRGAENIVQNGLFEPGLYDFALAEKFGPLDGQAMNYREWARLYLYGNAFWLAYPVEAAYYYGQLTGLAPNLADSNGFTAFYRYWQSLVHIADQLAAAEEWCEAEAAYQQALAARQHNEVQATASFVSGRCADLSVSDTATPTSTAPAATFTPSLTVSAGATATFTNTPVPGSTNTPMPTDTPMFTNTPAGTDTPAPSATFTPTVTPTP